MKKDFTQPFERPENIEISIFSQIEDGSFVLQRDDQEELGIQYLPLRTHIPRNKDMSMGITKFLYKNGLAITNLRKLVEEESIGFAFVDETPGRSSTHLVFYAKAELVEKHDAFIYVPLDEMNRLLDESASFVGDSEYAALDLLNVQL